MDERFFRYLLPAITQSAWPRLRRLEFWGVAAYSNAIVPEDRSLEDYMVDVPLSQNVQNEIRKAVGACASIDIRTKTERRFWLPEADAHGGVRFCDYEELDISDGETSDDTD